MKDFDKWNKEKQLLNIKNSKSYPHVRDVRICKLGINIGREQNGGKKDFSRPVLVIKKFNSTMFWVVPLSTKQKKLDFYYNFTDKNGNKVAVILAQMKLVSVNRFERMLYKLDSREFRNILTKLIGFLDT